MTGIMVVILIIAAVISVFLREYTDAAVIMIIVVINAILGFSQEYRAEKAMPRPNGSRCRACGSDVVAVSTRCRHGNS